MANIFTSAGYGFSTTSNSITRYLTLGDSTITLQSTEALAQVKCRTPGTASNLRVIVLSNARTTATTFTFRKGGADGNQVVSVGAGVTGIVEDTTHTDTLADGDLIDVKFVTSTGGGTIAVDYVDMRIAVTSGSAKQICASGSLNTSTASTTNYLNVAGILTSSGATEANARIPAPVALTLSNFQIYINSNGRSTTTTYRARINAANGNQVISVGAGVTGLLEDTTNSDSVTAGQLFNISRTTGTGTGTIATGIPGFKVVTDGAGFPVFEWDTSTSASATRYMPILGKGALNATETNIDYPVPFDCTVSDLGINISANASVTAVAFKSRIGAADGSLNATITAMTTGVFQDTTNSDSLTAGDLFDYSLTGMSVGSITPISASIFVTENAGSANLVAGPMQFLGGGFTANYGGQGFIDPGIQKIGAGT